MHELSRHFGHVRAVDGIDLEVRAGSTIALLGPNGAGKTTTIYLMLGVLAPDHGAVHLFGSSPRCAVAAGRVGAMLQDTGLMAGVRVGQLLTVIRELYPAPASLRELIDAASIAGLLRRRTDRLSGGQAQRVRFALAAAGNPDLLVLDEPTVGLDVQAREGFWARIRSHAARGSTVLFSTHYLEEAETYADRIVLLRSGCIVADGTAREITSSVGAGRVVRFRLLTGPPDRFFELPAVVAVHIENDRVTLHTSDADRTVWALYEDRDNIAELEVTGGDLHEAFLALTTADDPTQKSSEFRAPSS
ncbi:ABC transporter ATP-binding protein [uncultured Mycobacterium sp.]|uniref:ABC transporter ATP-binding protein n=1 Tax=uncultured Mycobacterium sp. TaxID=171292 RepID=UPI0035C9E769